MTIFKKRGFKKPTPKSGGSITPLPGVEPVMRDQIQRGNRGEPGLYNENTGQINPSLRTSPPPQLRRPGEPIAKDPNDPGSYGGWETWSANNPGGTLDDFRRLITLPSSDPLSIHGGTGAAYVKKPTHLPGGGFTPSSPTNPYLQGFNQISPKLGEARVPLPQIDPATGQPIVNPVTGQPIVQPQQPIRSQQPGGGNTVQSKIKDLYTPRQLEQPAMRRVFRILPIKSRRKFSA